MLCFAFALCLTFSLGAATGVHGADAERAKRVLMISTGSRLAPGFIIVDQQLLHALRNVPSARIETYAENLDLVRFPNDRFRQVFSDYLKAKYAEHTPDLVILIYAGNLGIAGKLLPQLFPGTPIIVAGLTEEEIRTDQFVSLVSGLAQRVDPRATLELIFRLQPEVRRIVVIGGTAEIDRQVLQRVKEAAQPFKGRIGIDYWDNLRMADLRQAVTALPPNTAILYARMFRDAAGLAFISSEVGQWIARAANVPVYVLTDASFGTGAVGGSLASIEAFSKRAGELARRILTGTPPASLPFEIRTDSVPMFDWRALKRWGIPESRLPPGSVVQFRQVSLWEQYEWYIIGALILIAIQAAMIVDLLLHRARRRRAEAELRESREFMDLATKAGELGLWVRDVSGDEVWANAPLRSLFGLGENDPLRLSDMFARIHPNDRARVVSQVQRAQEEGLPFEGEFRAVLPDGRERWALAKGRTVAVPGLGGNQRRVGVVFDITERKRVEEQLRESEARFRAVADAAPVMIWMSGPDKLCTFFNKGWLDFTGRALEQELGNGWADGVHRDDFDRCLEIYAKAFDARQEFTMEYRLRRFDGEYCWVLDNGVPRLDPDGTFLGYIGTCIDISERKRAEESVRESEKRIRMLLETTNAIPWEADAKTWQFTYVGPQAFKLLGYSPDRWREMEFWASHIHPDDREYAVAYCLDYSNRLKDYDFEYRMISADGRVVWIHDIVSVVAKDGAPETLRGFMIDVTERKQIEAMLKQERAFLRQVIDIDPSFIFAKDREGRFTLVNQAVADAYGTTVENVIGKTDADFNPNREEVEFFHRMDLEVIDTLQERFIPEERITDAQGKIRWLQTVKRPIVEKDGSANQVLGASTDITKRKEIDAELRRQREELAHVTRISTMGELAASLAHELNQPLTAILSNAQAAQRFLNTKPADLEEIKDILKDIVEDNSRAGEVIRRIRSLVKKEDIELARLDLPSVIRDVITLVHADASLRNIGVELECQDGLPSLRGDKVQLQQVVLNLLLNAFDAMKECPADERQVLVRIGSDGAGMVEVSVRDGGTGLTSAKLDQIFQPFFTTKRDGLGMGLSISRSIVDAHGGRLWAENNQDRGATFHVVLPALADAEQKSENSA
jgi:PAS domain S-box-containing protein